MIREIPRRYAKALYLLAKDSGEETQVFDEIRALGEAVEKSAEIKTFIEDPRISPAEKSGAMKGLFSSMKMSETTQKLVLLLAHKNRLMFFTEVVEAYQEQIDEDHGVTRGWVKSASALSPDARKSLEDKINKVTNKKVILNYKEDSSLIGGLVAQVGGWTFDDSLQTHLRRMKEELKRRATSGITG